MEDPNTRWKKTSSKIKFIEWKGIAYSHIIDPKTGYGISDPKSFTMQANTCLEADMFATIYALIQKVEMKELLSELSYDGVQIID